MIFSSYIFILAFLPIALILYFGMSRYVSRKVQHGFLVLASLFFYGYYNVSLVWLILASVVANYLLATVVQNQKDILRKLFFILAILFNVGLLGYYKYYGFFVENVNQFFGTHYSFTKVILPLGISFFTFQQIAYQISIWKRQERVPSFLDYTLFITFFPQIVAGPIVFSQDVMSQYQDEKNRFFDIDNFSKGLFIFLIGLFKKAVIADSISLIAVNGTYIQHDLLSFGGAWVTSLAYTMQIFFDFSGYSDMAIGLAKMMNINLPVNFYSPYKAKSITDFWKRWHMTLGRSLAVLVYYPLGGNRKGLVRTCFNLFMVFLVSGLWHGAAWTFIIWGVAHGVVRVFEKLFEKSLDKIPTFIRIFFTFMFVNAAWVMFAANDVKSGAKMLKKMFLPDRISFEGIGRLANDGILAYTNTVQMGYVLIYILSLLAIVFFYRKNSIDLYNEFMPSKKKAIMMAVVFCIAIVHMSRTGAFIYFNF